MSYTECPRILEHGPYLCHIQYIHITCIYSTLILYTRIYSLILHEVLEILEAEDCVDVDDITIFPPYH